MRFDTPQPDSTGRLRFGRTPPKQSIRLRMYVLFSALVLVLIAMRFAGNPANWHWLAPPQGQKQTKAPLELQQLDPPTLTEDEASENGLPNTGEAEMDLTTESDDSTDPDIQSLNPELSELEWDFWLRFVRQLDHPSRGRLFRLVFRVGELPPTAADIAGGENIFDRLGKFHQRYAATLLAQTSVTSGGADEEFRRRWYDLLFQWQTYQGDRLKLLEPLLKRDTTDSASALKNSEFVPLFDRLTVALVSDDTPAHQPEDQPLWDRMVQQVSSDHGFTETDDTADQVSLLQLTNQPKSYRGQEVAFTGRIMAAQWIPAGDTHNQVSQYLELWVQPEEGGRVPFCVFLTHAPKGFPAIEDTGLKTLEVSARFTGFFYKIRSYLGAENTLHYSPALLAVAAEIEPVSSAPPVQIGWPLIGSLSGLGLLIAVLCAWMVYRSSLIIRRGWRKSANVKDELKELESDNSIETIQQRLSRLS